MTKYDCIPDLLKKYMTETGTSRQWITVTKFRRYFQLPNDFSHPVSGFLDRIYKQSFSQFPYIVTRIERENRRGVSGSYHLRYFVTLKDDLQ